MLKSWENSWALQEKELDFFSVCSQCGKNILVLGKFTLYDAQNCSKMP